MQSKDKALDDQARFVNKRKLTNTSWDDKVKKSITITFSEENVIWLRKYAANRESVSHLVNRIVDKIRLEKEQG